MLKNIVSFLFQIFGMFIGILYLPQTYEIIQNPKIAWGISLLTFGFISFAQFIAVFHGYLNNDKKLMRAFSLAFMGSLSVVLATVWARYMT